MRPGHARKLGDHQRREIVMGLLPSLLSGLRSRKLRLDTADLEHSHRFQFKLGLLR
jgi:hypothetical protein